MNTTCEPDRIQTLDSDYQDLSVAPSREISQRVNCGVEITLYWHSRGGTLSVTLRNLNTGKTLELRTDPAAARSAYEHPFPYAAQHRIDFRDLLQVS